MSFALMSYPKTTHLPGSKRPRDDASMDAVRMETLSVGRHKFVTSEFMNAIATTGSHWAARPRVANGLAA